MSKEIATIDRTPTAVEAGTLAAVFRSARQSARKAMGRAWADKNTTDRYRRLVVDLTNDDVSFGGYRA